MGIKDPFSYSGRWDSVGLDCSNCRSFRSPLQWPDTKRTICCSFHKVSLIIELDKNGYKQGEWFCKDFENVNALPKAVNEFESIKESLLSRTLYKTHSENGDLLEFDMNTLDTIRERKGISKKAIILKRN